MSDFDKIINDHLNEEDGEFFPRREANWDKLTERLEAFETANPLPTQAPKPVMRAVWVRRALTSAAAALIGVSGLLIWHFNDVNSVQKENERLQQEIAVLKSNQQLMHPDSNFDTKSIVQKDKVVNQPEATDSPNKGTETTDAVKNRASNTPSVFPVGKEVKQAKLNENQQNASVVDTKSNLNKKDANKKESRKGILIQKRNDTQLTEMGNKKVIDAVPFDKNNEPLNKQKIKLNEGVAAQKDPSVSTSILEANKGVFVENKQNETTLPPKTGDDKIEIDRKDINNIEVVAQNTPTQNVVTQTDSPNVIPPVVDNKEDLEKAKADALAIEKAKEEALIKAKIAIQEEKSNAESAKATPPIIKTDKNFKKFLPKGFAVGLHGTYASAIPKIPGVMATKGKGLSAELMLTKNIALTASGDLVETHFELRERPKHFHLPDAPDPQKPNVGLHRIGGEQRSRLLSVNAKYVISEKWWIQPFVTLGHSWLKTDAHAVNFVFKDFTTGEETPSQAKVSTEKIKNLWQAGIGIQKKIKRWSFGVSAEIQKDFSAPTDPSGKTVASNFGILRGGVKFNIF